MVRREGLGSEARQAQRAPQGQKDVPAGTMAMVSSSDFLRAPERPTAIATLNRQRHLTPSCGGLTPTAERTVGPARISLESLTPRPGIREQNRHFSDLTRCPTRVRNAHQSGSPPAIQDLHALGGVDTYRSHKMIAAR